MQWFSDVMDWLAEALLSDIQFTLWVLALVLLPLMVAALTYWAVSWAMKSLRKVSTEVALRSVDNLDRLSVHEQPEELVPVATSVNQLLDGTVL